MTEEIVQELGELLNFLKNDELRIEIIKEEGEIKKVIVNQNSDQDIPKQISENNIGCKNNEDIDEDVLNKKILEVMLNLGLSISTKGFMYIYEAICILYKKNEKLIKNNSKWIFVEIGKKYDNISHSVRITIRTTIKIAWEKGNLEEQKNIFGYTREESEKHPGNREFVNSIVAYLKEQK